jgi:hypothetical protein
MPLDDERAQPRLDSRVGLDGRPLGHLCRSWRGRIAA